METQLTEITRLKNERAAFRALRDDVNFKRYLSILQEQFELRKNAILFGEIKTQDDVLSLQHSRGECAFALIATTIVDSLVESADLKITELTEGQTHGNS